MTSSVIRSGGPIGDFRIQRPSHVVLPKIGISRFFRDFTQKLGFQAKYMDFRHWPHLQPMQATPLLTAYHRILSSVARLSKTKPLSKFCCRVANSCQSHLKPNQMMTLTDCTVLSQAEQTYVPVHKTCQ